MQLSEVTIFQTPTLYTRVSSSNYHDYLSMTIIGQINPHAFVSDQLRLRHTERGQKGGAIFFKKGILRQLLGTQR